MKNYKVFKRTWWKYNKDYPNGLEPSAGPKKHVCYFNTEEEARNFCMHNNKNNLPANNTLSLKYEYTQV